MKIMLAIALTTVLCTSTAAEGESAATPSTKADPRGFLEILRLLFGKLLGLIGGKGAPQSSPVSTQSTKEASQGTKGASQVSTVYPQSNKEATQDAKEATKDNKEATQDAKEATQDAKEATQHAKEATQDNKEATQDAKRSPQSPKEASQIAKEATQIAKQATQDAKVATQDAKEATQANKEATQDAKRSPQSPKETSQIAKEATQIAKQATQDAKEVTQDNKEATQDAKRSPQSPKETSQIAKEATQIAKAATQDAKRSPQRVLVGPEEDSKLRGIPYSACSIPNLFLTSKVYLNLLSCGRKFDAEKFALEPEVKFRYVDEKSFYTFMIITCGPYLRWGVLNIPGKVFRWDGIIGGYDQLMAYEKVTVYPFEGEAEDCYYKALLYKQETGHINETVTLAKGERLLFNATEFAEKHHLLGPEAGTQALLLAKSLA